MNLKQLEAFVKIANNKSFSKTAGELYLTQPTVSAYISSLENELGESLFLRSTRGVELSESGRKLYIYAKEITELVDKIEQTFSKNPDEGRTQLIISASSIPATYLLPGILAGFNRKYPNVEFRIYETDSSGVVEDLTEHRADIGFAGTVIGAKGIRFTPFYEDELVLVTPVSAKYRQHKNAPGDLSWIRDEAWILRSGGSGTQKEAAKALKAAGIELDDLQVTARFSNTGAILLAVKEGVGIAVVSMLAAKEPEARGEILTFPLGGKGAFRAISLVTGNDIPASGSCKKFIRFVKEMYKA